MLSPQWNQSGTKVLAIEEADLIKLPYGQKSRLLAVLTCESADEGVWYRTVGTKKAFDTATEAQQFVEDGIRAGTI